MSLTIGARPVLIPGETIASTSGPATAKSGPGFADALGAAIHQVEGAQAAAQSAVMGFLNSGQGDIHTIALASQRAELAVELFQQVRNKFVSAYQEIMKMPM